LVRIVVFDVLGRTVEVLLSERKPAGEYSVRWDAEKFPAGVYFYQLQTESSVQANRMILLK
jgi:hypothetical protein